MPTRLYKPLALAVLTVFSLPSMAVQVNDMSVFSAAGQPLRMDIELTDAGVNPAATLVRVASAEEHARLGLTRPEWADGVRFKLLKEEGNKLVARATTSAPVADEFVTFLVYIRADGQSRLQQVAAKTGGQAIASSSASVITASAPASKPKPKPKAPAAEPVAVVEAPAPVAAPTPAPAPAPAVKSAPAAKAAAAPVPAAPAAAAAPAPAADTAEGIAQERKALTQGLDAAKAQVADLESQLQALDAREASLKAAAAPADATAPAAEAPATDATVATDAVAPAADVAAAPEAAPATDASQPANEGDSFNPLPLFAILAVFGLLAGLSHIFRRRTDTLPG